MRHERILASAGTGKTWCLSGRFIALLAQGMAPGSILATTFTRAAAGEIRDRTLGRLAEAALDPVKAKETGITGEQAATALVRMVAELDRLRIQTLDSFFTGIVRGFATEFGMPLDPALLDEHGTAMLDEEALIAVLDAARRDDDEDRLLATLESLRKGRPASRFLASMRMHLKGALEIAREGNPAAWRWNLPPVPRDATAFHAALARIEAIAAASPGLEKVVGDDVRALRESPGLPEVEKAIEACGRGLVRPLRAGLRVYSRKEIPDELAEAYAPVVETLEAIVLDGYVRQTRALHELASGVLAARHSIKRARGTLEFDDLVRAVVDAGEDVDLASVFFRLDGRVRHLLLDEFQDTSGIQWKALSPLLDEIKHADPPERSLFVVGDLKQSIYGWRGASPAILADLPGRLGLDATRLASTTLAKSFRSSPPVLDGVNRVFRRIRERAGEFGERSAAIARWCEGFEPHESADRVASNPGVVHVRVTDAADGKRGSAASKEAVRSATVELVRELQRDHPGRSIAVIVRTNRTAADLVNRLNVAGIAASAFGSGALQDAAAVNAVLDALVLADHPDHTAACFNVASSPLGSAVALPAAAHRDAAARRAWSREERARLDCEGVAARIGTLAALARPHADARESVRLDQLVDRAARLETELDRLPPHDPRRRPAAIAAALRGSAVEDPAGDAVQVMTVHQSKGLDFDFTVTTELDRTVKAHAELAVARPDPCEPPVAVVRWPDQDACPDAFRDACRETADRLVEESLSVLYVSLTRAKLGMFLVVAAPAERKSKSSATPLDYGAIVRESLAPELAAGQGLDVFGSLASIGPARAKPAAAAPEASGSTSIAFAAARGVRAVRARPASHHGPDVESPLRIDRDAADRGTAIHAAFELVRWSDDPAPVDAAIAAAIRAELPRAETAWIAARIAEFRLAFASPEVRRTLARPEGPATVLLEHPFLRRRPDGLQSGLIDRLVLLGDPAMPHAAEIVDFKTDWIDAADAGRWARERHAGQLRAYRDAVAERFRIDPKDIRLRVLFVTPSAGEPVAVDLD